MTIVIHHNQQKYGKGSKPLRDKVNDFFQLLIGAADESNEFSSFQRIIADLNRGCDAIFRLGGSLLKALVIILAGEPDQNAQTRGESSNYDHS